MLVFEATALPSFIHYNSMQFIIVYLELYLQQHNVVMVFLSYNPCTLISELLSYY